MGDLEIPESNREIALHLAAFKSDLAALNAKVDGIQRDLDGRRTKRGEIVFSASLMAVLPLIGGFGMLLLAKVIGLPV